MKKTDAESDVKIFRVRSEDAFNLPEFRNLIEEAFSGGIPVDSETAVLELSRLIEHPSLNIIVAKEDGKMKGLSIAMLPSCLLFQDPQVYHFFSKGSREMREMLMARTIEFFKIHKYETFIGSTFRPDKGKAFQRLFRSAGRSELIASSFRFKMEDTS